ncbi:MAG: hypothetical protein IH589_02830 [Anaerolineales bacterium]|nr:hypothetical protein [Anaerolineales bacterium]
MKINKLIQSAMNKNKPQPELEDEVIIKFLHVLEHLKSEEISCGELYAHLDEFVEREVEKKDAARIMPLLRDHLDICNDCCEEYEALLTVLENTKEEGK